MDYEELKTEILNLLYRIQDENGISAKTSVSSAEVSFRTKNISLGVFQTALDELKKLGCIEQPSDTGIRLKSNIFREMLLKAEKVSKEQAKMIEIAEYETVTNELTEITKQVEQNNEVSDEVKNIAKNLENSNQLLIGKSGKVSKAFINYMVKALKALYELLKGALIANEIGELIMALIEKLSSLPM